jgi:light-regulated signal transduction histidine kinase (bacteriophytochrome)
VISNLLHNATKFTEPGGAIHVSGRISDNQGDARPELALTVSDSGIGTPREFLPRVFDLFSHGDRRTAYDGESGVRQALTYRPHYHVVPELATDSPACLEPVDAGHADVEQHHVDDAPVVPLS